MKKIWAVLMLAALCCTAACGPQTAAPTENPTQTSAEAPTEAPTRQVPEKGLFWFSEAENWTLEGGEGAPSAFTVRDAATVMLKTPYEDGFNRYTFQIRSSQPLWGELYYTRNGEDYTESFYIEAQEEEALRTFNSYIDGFAEGVSGAGLTGFRLINRGAEPAEIRLESLKLSREELPGERVTIQNEYMKVGASLLRGGALDYVEYRKEKVDAVRYRGRVEVGINYADLEGAELITSTVNLLNTHDQGRLVQQSYYGTSSAPYECGEFNGRKWNYNPVQGGDRGLNNSKIVDFAVTENSIYVKCRPMDWGKINSPTPSYMEATYTIDGNVLRVDNRFVDFSGYTHPATNQELPAFYVIEPLYTLVCNSGKTSWPEVEDMTYRDDLPFWDGTWEQFRNRDAWWAWINGKENAFGIGLYVPTVSAVIGGMYRHGGDIPGEPSDADPTSYIAAIRQLQLISYLPLTYSYAISVGRLSDIRATFKQLADTKAIDNTALKRYGRK